MQIFEEYALEVALLDVHSCSKLLSPCANQTPVIAALGEHDENFCNLDQQRRQRV
jgi:hypothetical protein